MGEIAKLVLVQPLADHDGAAILSIGILDFDLQTGICKEVSYATPDLEEQVEEGREITVSKLQKFFKGESTSTPFLVNIDRNYFWTCEEVCLKLIQELFNFEGTRPRLFFFESWKSFPVLKSFVDQFCPEGYQIFPVKKPVDAESLSRYPRDTLITEEDAFAVCIDISLMYNQTDDGK